MSLRCLVIVLMLAISMGCNAYVKVETKSGAKGEYGSGKLPLKDPAYVCEDTEIQWSDGTVTNGIRKCAAALETTELKPENIKAGVKVGGVVGVFVESGDLGALKPENILKGVRVGHVTGVLEPPPAECQSSGEINCMVGPKFVALTSDAWPLKVASTETLAAVTGKVRVPSVGKVLQGVKYGSPQAPYEGRLILPDPSKVLKDSVSYGSSSDPKTPNFTPQFPSPSNVRAVSKVGSDQGLIPDCQTDGQVNCVATVSFRAVDTGLAIPGNIKAQVVIAGQTGAYPSATYPLPSASASTADLRSETLSTQLASTDTFEYWTSDGQRHQGQGSAALMARNLLFGKTVFGINGSAYPVPCAYTNQASCVADNACQWSQSTCSLNPWNIRTSVTIANMTGKIKTNCRNRGLSSLLNIDSMPPGNSTVTTGTVFNWWDTLDQSSGNNYSVSTEQPADWTSDHYCSTELWSDVTPDGACDSSSDDCMMRDNITGLIWSESYPVSGSAASTTELTWSAAVQHCNNLNFGGKTGWRLPTQMELQDAYAHGLTDLVYKNGGTIRPGGDTLLNNNDFVANKFAYWSATTDSSTTANAYNLSLAWSFSNSVAKNTSTNFSNICVNR